MSSPKEIELSNDRKSFSVIGRGLSPMYKYFKLEEPPSHLEVIGRGLTPMYKYFPSEKSKEK